MTPPPHPTRALRHPSGESVDVDVDLADVIAALWARGIDTEQSCQEHRPGTGVGRLPDRR